MLIAMAVFDTVENKRTEMTEKTIRSLSERVNWNKHRLIISDNGSCGETLRLYKNMSSLSIPFEVIFNGENLGTARAVNRAWSKRKPGEHVVKMDNDCVINHTGWADEMSEVFDRDPTIGICGLKRKDLDEHPGHKSLQFKTSLKMLPHQPGQTWIIVEEASHIMGTCQGFSSALFDKIGYLYQGDWKYGFDDTLASLRSKLAGFRNVFIPHINIDHIDPGGDVYAQQKKDEAGVVMDRYNKLAEEYRSGRKPIYFDGGDDYIWSK